VRCCLPKRDYAGLGCLSALGSHVGRRCGRALRPASGKRVEPQPCAESRSALAGSAVWGAQNYTYTEDAQGLVAWLNKKIANSSFRIVHVTLPTGNVSRGTANLIGLPTGLNLVIQGQGMSGATATTLNLQQKNLDIGAMLSDTGRIEFRNMGITNVRTAASAFRSSCRDSCCLCRAIQPRYACTTPCLRMLADTSLCLLCLFAWSDVALAKRGSLAAGGGRRFGAASWRFRSLLERRSQPGFPSWTLIAC
jgi:hypothetical protein